MGENEQGGMLRTVVVVGIIAMVALIIALGVVGLKSNLQSNMRAGTPPDQIFTPGDAHVSNRSDFGESTMKIIDGTLVMGTPASSSPKWARYDTARRNVTSDQKVVKFTVTAEAMPDSMYVHPWVMFFDDNDHEINVNSYVIIPTDGKMHTVSKEFAVPDKAKTYAISLQARESSHVTYQSATVTFYSD